MAAKRYYWLKLKEDFFDEDIISWLEEQENGKEYCLFYLKLCLKSLKSNGVLIRRVGEILVPYDAKKLAEITRTHFDTVVTAMQLFEKTGLVQFLENGEIFLTQLSEMVGSETKWAEKKRLYREKEKRLQGQSADNVLPMSDKSIEKEKEKEKDIEIEKEKDKKEKRKRFSPPTLEELKAYISEKNLNVDAERFIDYYTANGWKVGKNSMKDWKATARNWDRENKQQKQQADKSTASWMPQGDLPY